MGILVGCGAICYMALSARPINHSILLKRPTTNLLTYPAFLVYCGGSTMRLAFSSHRACHPDSGGPKTWPFLITETGS